jgi:hypothetical protein
VSCTLNTLHIFEENKLAFKKQKTFNETQNEEGNKMKKRMIALLICAVMFTLAQFACADITWNGSAGDFQWGTPSNWDTGAVPTALSGTTIILSSSSTIQIAAGETFDLGVFVIADTGDASLNVAGTLNMTNGNVYIPRNTGNSQTATVTVPNGGIFNWSDNLYVGPNKGTGILSIDGGSNEASSLTLGGTGWKSGPKAVFVANDYDLTLSGLLNIGYNNCYGCYTNTGGGEISCSTLQIGGKAGDGVLSLESGKLTVSGTMSVAKYGNSDGLLVAADGTDITIGGDIYITFQEGDEGSMKLGAMTFSQSSNKKIDIAGYNNLSRLNGMVELRGTTVSQGAGSNIKLGVLGTMIGYGSLSSSSSSWFDNSGTVTASGFGTDQDLIFSGYNTMLQSTAGNGTNGWYSKNGGRLALPAISVTTGNSTNNIAEAASATVLDLVNSARITLNTAEAGSLSYKLYASDRTDVPAGLEEEIVTSIWEISAPSFDSAELTFKLPDVDAADNLKLLRYNGTKWKEVGTVDATTDFATATELSASGDANLGFFAVASLPDTTGTLFIIN